MISSQALAACIMLASSTYNVPPAVMIGILNVEGGRIGQEVRNTNGSYDLGPMQVNTIWVPQLASAWRVDYRRAKTALRDDGCLNVKVAAWILKQKIESTGSLYGGIAHYHSATPWRGHKYAAKVVSVLERKGLIRRDGGMSARPARQPTVADIPRQKYVRYAQK